MLGKIRWNREAQKALAPMRGAVAAAAKSVEAARQVLAAAWKQEEPALRAGLAGATRDVAALTERTLAYAETRWEEGATLDPELEGVIACVLLWGKPSPPTEAVLTDLLARGGPAFAVRALAARAQWFTRHPMSTGQYGLDLSRTTLARADAHGQYFFLGRADDERAPLVHAILSADDATYAQVVETVRALRERAAPMLRASLDGLVPTEHAWARQSAEELLGTRTPAESDVLGALLPCLDDPALAERVLHALMKPWALGRWAFDGVRAAQERALEPLAAYVESVVDDPPKANMGLAEARRVARALALFDDARAARAFAPWIEDTRALGPIAREFFQEHPAHAFAALGGSLLEKGRKAEPAQRVLEALARTDTDAVRAVLPALSADVRAAAEKLLERASGPSSTEEAPLDALPPVLRAPPWRSRQPRPEIPVLEGLAIPAMPERVVWDDEERARIAAPPGGYATDGWSSRRDAELQKLAALIDGGERPLQFYERVLLPFHAMPDDEAVRLFHETPLWAREVVEHSGWQEIPYMVARFGERILPGLPQAAAERITPPTFRALLHCESVRLVPVVLRGLSRGATRRLAQQWLERYPAAAAAGSIPIALGPAGRARNDATSALRSLDAAGRRSIVLETAAGLGDEARRATELLLDADPLAECPRSAPKLSAYVELAALPPLLLVDGRRAPEAAVRHLLEMLQFTPAEPPYAGVAQVRGVFQPASLDAVLRALLNAWIAAGGASASAWPLRAIGHVGSDDLARELAGLVRRWPREKAKPRALLGVDVLGMMGTDLALMHLADLSKTAKNKDVEARAAERLAEAAAARGLGPEELDDRLTPTLGLARDGTTQIDFGPRAFRVAIDDRLEAQLFEGDRLLKSLPRASGDDDPELAKAGKARWQSLRDDLERVRASLALRMELAMIRGRRWDASALNSLFVQHPLASRLARRLVWGAFEGDGRGRLVATFRVAEDGTLADADDQTFVPASDEQTFGIVHPLELAHDEHAPVLSRWGTIFGDYHLISPFPQLDRRITRIGPGDGALSQLPILRGREIPYRMLSGRLEARGYRRGSPDGDGVMSEFSRAMSESTVWVRFSPGHRVREAPPELVTIDVSFDDGSPLGRVPALDLSEACFDLAPFDL